MTDRIYGDAPSSLIILRCITFVVPLLLAAGIVEQSANQAVLPDNESYRSNFSDTILESSDWRKPPETKLQWREPPRPALGWRTPPSKESSTTSSGRRIKLFPKYRPGRTSDFDYITREEKPMIKIFEFDP